jgi:hypothetical protein
MPCKRCANGTHKFKPKYLVDNTADKDMGKGWTMVLCFSRPWCVVPFFADFERLEFDRSKCHLLIYNNTNDPFLDKLLFKRANRYRQSHKQKYGERKLHKAFASVRLYKSFRPYGGIVFGQQVSWEASKLPAIYEMQKDIAGLVTTEKFFMLEDDTLVPPHAVKRMFRLLERSRRIGLVSGVEPTRSPRLTDKARLGTYILIRKGGKILERLSLPPDLSHVHEVDATGFYCLAARTHAWRKAGLIMDRELVQQKTAEPNWAIDTLWTNDVQRAGFKVLADFETPCMHMQPVGDRIYNWALDRAVEKIDFYIEKYDVYAQGVEL